MNISEDSLNQKVRSVAKQFDVKDVNKVRATLALERLVARIRNSEFLSEQVIFCGGFVLYKEGLTDRYTKDVDMICGSKITRK